MKKSIQKKQSKLVNEALLFQFLQLLDMYRKRLDDEGRQFLVLISFPVESASVFVMAYFACKIP